MKKAAFLLAVCLFYASSAQTAGPLMHLLLAQKWEAIHQRAFLSPAEKDEFHMGCLFPDIRYLGVIERGHTHGTGIQPADLLLAPTAFGRGMRHHALVDELREQYVLAWNMYDRVGIIQSQYRTTFLKMIEDEILYRCKPIGFEAAKFLDRTCAAEMQWGIAPDTVEKWHKALRRYLSMPPSYHINDALTSGQSIFGVPVEELKIWSLLVPAFVENKEMKEYVFRIMRILETESCMERHVRI